MLRKTLLPIAIIAAGAAVIGVIDWRSGSTTATSLAGAPSTSAMPVKNTNMTPSTTPPPPLTMVVKNTYMAHYYQNISACLQSVTYGNQKYSLPIDSKSESCVTGNSVAVLTDIDSFIYGSPYHVKLYSKNGVILYMSYGHGWMRQGNTKVLTSTSTESPETMAKMSEDWHVVNVHAIPGGFQYSVTDAQHGIFRVLDGLVGQALLWNHRQVHNDATFESRLMKHIHETMVIQTVKVDGSERIRKQTITLSIHLTPEQIKALTERDATGSSNHFGAESIVPGVSTAVEQPLNAIYRSSINFAYQAVPVPAPKGLPS